MELTYSMKQELWHNNVMPYRMTLHEHLQSTRLRQHPPHFRQFRVLKAVNRLHVYV